MPEYRVDMIELLSQRVVFRVQASSTEEAIEKALARDGEVVHEEILEVHDTGDIEVEER